MRRLSYILIVILLTLPYWSIAQTLHFVGFNTYGGMCGAVCWADHKEIEKSIGGFGEVGAQYRLFHNHFLFDIGLGAQYAYVNDYLSDINTDEWLTDDEDEPYLGHLIYTNRHALSHQLSVVLPVRVGVEYKRFYFLTGAKVNARVFGTRHEEGKRSTTGDYTYYMETFHDMPEHGFYSGTEYSLDQQAVPFKTNVFLNIEMGGRLGQFVEGSGFQRNASKKRYYLGAVAEFGLLDLGSHQLNYNVGIKFTMLFQQSPKPKCVICKDLSRYAK